MVPAGTRTKPVATSRLMTISKLDPFTPGILYPQLLSSFPLSNLYYALLAMASGAGRSFGSFVAPCSVPIYGITPTKEGWSALWYLGCFMYYGYARRCIDKRRPMCCIGYDCTATHAKTELSLQWTQSFKL